MVQDTMVQDTMVQDTMVQNTVFQNTVSKTDGPKQMAKCDGGYRCEVCTNDVPEITDSDLYLRFVIGLVDPETLHTTQERHIRCNPSLAQFIVDPNFAPVTLAGDFDKRMLDQAFVAEREKLVTRGWRRLKEVARSNVTIQEYPLPEIHRKMKRQANSK